MCDTMMPTSILGVSAGCIIMGSLEKSVCIRRRVTRTKLPEDAGVRALGVVR